MENKTIFFTSERKKYIFSWIKPLIISILLVFVTKLFLFTPFIITGPSMLDTLKDNERVIANKLTYIIHDYKIGDIIVFSYGEELELVKRIIAVPGDKIEVKENNLYINEEMVIEPYTDSFTNDFGPILVPEEQLFVMGDNRNNSKDSRNFGPINIKDVIGRVDFVYWPLSNIRILY